MSHVRCIGCGVIQSVEMLHVVEAAECVRWACDCGHSELPSEWGCNVFYIPTSDDGDQPTQPEGWNQLVLF